MKRAGEFGSEFKRWESSWIGFALCILFSLSLSIFSRVPLCEETFSSGCAYKRGSPVVVHPISRLHYGATGSARLLHACGPANTPLWSIIRAIVRSILHRFCPIRIVTRYNHSLSRACDICTRDKIILGCSAFALRTSARPRAPSSSRETGCSMRDARFDTVERLLYDVPWTRITAIDGPERYNFHEVFIYIRD